MTALEREARKLAKMSTCTPYHYDVTGWLALARYVRAERRRARGRTLGYVGVSMGSRIVWHDELLSKREADEEADAISGFYRVARVVAEPKKGKARRVR
jgi:hypothetical protein